MTLTRKREQGRRRLQLLALLSEAEMSAARGPARSPPTQK